MAILIVAVFSSRLSRYTALFLVHSITIGDTVFMVTQLVNVIALAIILVLARRFRNQICAAHARQLHLREQLKAGLN
jgi:cell shape-determining protein MreD